MKNETAAIFKSVIFRRWKGEDHSVLAFFPYLPFDDNGMVTAYAHVGQHSGASLAVLRAQTIPAEITEPDVFELYKELEVTVGYRMHVIKRVSYK